MNNTGKVYTHKNGTAIRRKGGFRPFNEGYTPAVRRYSQLVNGIPANTLERPRAPKGGSGELRRREEGETGDRRKGDGRKLLLVYL